jgi:hypothetical protein
MQARAPGRTVLFSGQQRPGAQRGLQAGRGLLAEAAYGLARGCQFD